MRAVTVSKFRAQYLELLDAVLKTGETIVIADNGQPIAQLGPAVRKPATLFGANLGGIEIMGDIEAPIAVVWEIDSKSCQTGGS